MHSPQCTVVDLSKKKLCVRFMLLTHRHCRFTGLYPKLWTVHCELRTVKLHTVKKNKTETVDCAL
ncbi:MAG: hypothetical protein LBL66_03710 [Clostridiales bacterium]|nr:hypothetical protein [Clostridiales bacterium]